MGCTKAYFQEEGKVWVFRSEIYKQELEVVQKHTPLGHKEVCHMPCSHGAEFWRWLRFSGKIWGRGIRNRII